MLGSISAMNVRLVLITLLFVFGGLSALLALQWKFGIGDFITSPQQVTLGLESRMIVGGGRAGIEFVRRRDDRAQLMVRCMEDKQWVTLRLRQTSEEICSVRIRLVEFSSETGTLATSRAHLEVTWKATEAPEDSTI